MALARQSLTLPEESERVLAKVTVDESFSPKSNALLDDIASEVKPLLTDYFLLHTLIQKQETESKSFKLYDYGVLLQPVQKALESFCGTIIKFFGLPVSHKMGETIGSYLINEQGLEKIKVALEKESKQFKAGIPDLAIEPDEWIRQFRQLGEEWKSNRNPQSHADAERIESSAQAQTVAGSIIRQMDLASKVFQVQYFGPFVAKIREIRKRKEEEDRKAAIAAATPAPSNRLPE